MTGTRWAETLPDVVCDDMGDDVGLEPDAEPECEGLLPDEVDADEVMEE